MPNIIAALVPESESVYHAQCAEGGQYQAIQGIQNKYKEIQGSTKQIQGNKREYAGIQGGTKRHKAPGPAAPVPPRWP